MKSSTDIEQSKKLAEILLLESADMYYDRYGDPYFINVSVTHERIKNDKYQHLIPCWSLTALLSILPRVDIEKEICSDDTYDYRVKAYIGDGYIGDWYDNPVDACVDMIERLHELNLL